MNAVRERVQESLAVRKRRQQGHMAQDIGILLFVLCVFIASVTTALAPSYLLVQELAMLGAVCVGVLLAAYGFRYIAVAEAGIQMLLFTVYILFRHRTEGLSIHWSCYVWAFLPLLSVGAMLLFQAMNYQNEQMNALLSKQMSELVLIHPLTGLYNTRALYVDLERQMAYAKRNHLELSLICIELRYASELQKAMSTGQFDRLRQALAQCVEDTLRLEDRVYSTDDDNGSLAAILTCGAAGAAVVKNRIKHSVQESKLFDQIVNQALRIDLRIAFLAYDPQTITDAMDFRQRVDNELQYDV